MGPRAGIVGVGWSGFAPTTEGTSYKELMFEAARVAYADAGLDPRRQIVGVPHRPVAGDIRHVVHRHPVRQDVHRRDNAAAMRFGDGISP